MGAKSSPEDSGQRMRRSAATAKKHQPANCQQAESAWFRHGGGHDKEAREGGSISGCQCKLVFDANRRQSVRSRYRRSRQAGTRGIRGAATRKRHSDRLYVREKRQNVHAIDLPIIQRAPRHGGKCSASVAICVSQAALDGAADPRTSETAAAQKFFCNIDLRFGVKVKHRAKTHCGWGLRLAQ